MSTIDNIDIKIGLPENYYSEAAIVYTEAFYEKTQKLFGSQEKMKSLLLKSLNPELAIAAFVNNRLVGLAGMAFNDRHFITPSLSVFIEEFGFFSGLLKYLGYQLLALRPYDRGQLLLDGIAVAPTMRGRGVGTLLIEAIGNYAKQNSLNSVCLEVVDTNPKARKLYERLGFKETKINRYPFLKNIMGIEAISTMVKQVSTSE